VLIIYDIMLLQARGWIKREISLGPIASCDQSIYNRWPIRTEALLAADAAAIVQLEENNFGDGVGTEAVI